MGRWKHFPNSNYFKRFFDFTYQGHQIHLAITVRWKFHTPNLIRMVWSSDKLRGSKYEVDTFWQHGRGTPPFREAFKKLRLSLSYGLNVKARPVIEKMMKANKQELPHKRYTVSGKLQGLEVKKIFVDEEI